MGEWIDGTTLRITNFNITLVPGGATIQAATVQYEMVLPSGRAVGPFEKQLDLAEVQATVDSAAGSIAGQLLAYEGVQAIWTPPPP